MQPLVSIVCTVYSKAPWLSKTIDSFLKQETDFPFDIILIDDCSTDGSKAIIQEYVQKYPLQIKAFFNDENMGIARTWLKVCDLVSAQYLARCDGDDYWTDSLKLQKQVETLKANPKSKWSSTDVDFVNEIGEIMGASIFESQQMPYVHDFETMLATRGFLAPSTWLVDTKLIQEVNHGIDLDTADDTFDIQLDLFEKTELTYLPQSTVAYRVNQGSDSRPTDFEKIHNRFNKLLATQKKYLDKYPNSDYRKMLDILLERNNRYELELTRQAAGLEQLGFERVTIYYDQDGQGFNQEGIQQFSLSNKDEIGLTLPENCHRIRIDLSEKPSFYDSVALIARDTGTQILPAYTNGIALGNAIVFPNPDPQMIFELPQNQYGQNFVLTYQTSQINDVYAPDYIGKNLAQKLSDLKGAQHVLLKEKIVLLTQQKDLETKIEEQRESLERITQLYHGAIGSRRWIIPTKIINFLRRKK
ncbi:glycosyltransferase [Streptococcus sp. X16XC17]|uniref:glycosyltransferase n=1 Tax=unclassified Streptococcus TaxID=2608887 RepID=UPI00066FFDB1|nr:MULTISPECIES: glycosyltransferase [unclassified Streptococcus]TCD46514.1 glycosyltransferase [Streptococcus sp. X16XC17]